MANNLRTFTAYSCEERNTFFAYLKTEVLQADFQSFTEYNKIGALHNFR